MNDGLNRKVFKLDSKELRVSEGLMGSLRVSEGLDRPAAFRHVDQKN